MIRAEYSLSDLSECCSGTAEEMSGWCLNNSLKLNAEKTGIIVFSKGDTQGSLLVKTKHKSIAVADSIKFLGVTLDTCLSWEQHIDKLNSRLNSACAVIRRLKNTISLNCLRIYYFAHVSINYKLRDPFLGFFKACHKNFHLTKKNN